MRNFFSFYSSVSWWWKQHDTPKRRYACAGLRGVTCLRSRCCENLNPRIPLSSSLWRHLCVMFTWRELNCSRNSLLWRNEVFQRHPKSATTQCVKLVHWTCSNLFLLLPSRLRFPFCNWFFFGGGGAFQRSFILLYIEVFVILLYPLRTRWGTYLRCSSQGGRSS